MDTTKIKIICIVKNDSSDNSSGLIHAFDGDTNDFIKKYFYESKTDFSTLFGNQTNYKYLLINKNSVIPKNEPPSNQDVWDILLVCDNIDDDAKNSNEIKEIKKIPFTPKTLVMYHQQPQEVNKYFNDLQNNNIIRKCKEGHHEPNPEEGYQLLLELTKAWNGTEFESQAYAEAKRKLIKWFSLNEKLNKALEFLHKSLGGTPADISILKNVDEQLNLQVMLKNDNKEKTLQEWIDVLKVKKGIEYNQTLAIVRNALLEQAGVTGEN